MRRAIALAALLLTSTVPAAWADAMPVPMGLSGQHPAYPQNVGNPALARELVDMEYADQVAGHHTADHGLAVRRANTQRMGAIIDQYGWPGWKLVGKTGAGAAWLVVQNATDPALQKRCLPLLEDAVKRGDAARDHVAYLTDRVLQNAGQLQRFGTQFGVTDDRVAPSPVEDPAHLDARRKAMGLGTEAEAIAAMEQSSDLEHSLEATKAQELSKPELSQELLVLRAEQAAEPYRLANYTPGHRARNDAMRSILARDGWPTRAEVGQRAQDAAWRLVLDGDTELRRQSIPLLEKAVKQGEASPDWWATMVDQIQCADRGTQHFGEVITIEGGKRLLACPLEDPTKVAEWRAKAGLLPLAPGLEVYHRTPDPSLERQGLL